MAYRVLICEDEAAIRDFVVVNLLRAGYDAVGVETGEQAVQLFLEEEGRFDVALLDVMLPGIDGFEVCKRLRQESTNLGIIMLSAKTQEIDKVSGIMIGADDYVTKPFSPSELLARIDALMRRIDMMEKRGMRTRETVLKSGPFELDLKNHILYKNQTVIELTQVEYQIIEYFIRNKDVALKRSAILSGVWGDGYIGEEKIVDVNIRRIRMKIEDDPSDPQFIQTVWGIGYKWPTVKE